MIGRFSPRQGLLALLAILAASPAAAQDFDLHAQFTNITQYHPAFTSPFRGPNSLDPGSRGNEAADADVTLTIHVVSGLDFTVAPEIDQGFGLSDTVGVAGFPNGEAAKVGMSDPYVRLPRAFFHIEPADELIVTLGKFSVVDVFDTNAYAHDPRADFLNWSIIDSGAFDYAADAWGYSYGGSIEWTRSWWTLRAGLFDLSVVPNGKALERDFAQFELAAEAEERHEFAGLPGKLRLLVFENRGRMAKYADALRLGLATNTTPDVSLVRRYSGRPGLAASLEQTLATGLGFFLRAGLNDGTKEAYEFTEINRSIATGVSLDGDLWHRPGDAIGVAGAINDISSDARRYFAAGGLGILVGDGRLPHYAAEVIVEIYYKLQLAEGVALTLDFQHVQNPAYDVLRGPVEIFGYRLHFEI